MMTVEESIRQRRTVRLFTDEPVSAVDIREMLALASQAPNVGNRQMWRFIVIANPALRQMLADLVRWRIDDMATWPEFEGESQRVFAWRELSLHFANAPLVVAFVNQGYRTPIDAMLIQHGFKFWEVPGQFGYPDVQSVSAAIAYFTLLAQERGYATNWMTGPLIAKKDLQQALELPSGEELLALVAVGKPAEHPAPKPRRAIDEIIDWR